MKFISENETSVCFLRQWRCPSIALLLLLLFFKLILLIGYSPAEHCDRASPARMREGNLGQSGVFNWLGTLHVHLHEMIATSGIVLIKIKYALANADDVARIPQYIFKSNSRAMFLATQDTPWYAKPVSYITHPEYEYSMLNSIAIIELDLSGLDDFPLTPICLPTVKTLNTSRYFYLIGFTHENEILEKVLYEIQYLDKQICEEFYNKEELSSPKVMPSAYVCGYSPNSATQCVWDNGMTLVSNSFGYLNLIGFGVHGPGCAAPARFIDLFPYFQWIHSITDNVGDRRNDFVPKSKRKEIPVIPMHELYTLNGSRRAANLQHQFHAYPKEFKTLKFHLVKPSLTDKNTYLIFPFKNMWEGHKNACTLPTAQIYRESFELQNPEHNKRGSVIYKLSLYDEYYTKCICVRLTVVSDKSSNAVLAFKEEINFKDDTEMDPLPQEIFRDFPLPRIPQEPKVDILADYRQPQFIWDYDILYKKVKNYDLYITFEYTKRAKLEFVLLAKPPTIKKLQLLRRRAKTRHRRVKTKSKSLWGVDNWADKMLMEAEVIVREEDVHDTWSAARGKGAPGAVVMAGWIIACLSRAIFHFLH